MRRTRRRIHLWRIDIENQIHYPDRRGEFNFNPWGLIKAIFRAQSLDRLSMKSDATGSVKSQSLPDISIKLSVGSLCSQCHRPLYEEEIMSGWSTEPSCMMTECPWCRLVSVFRSFDFFR